MYRFSFTYVKENLYIYTFTYAEKQPLQEANIFVGK